MNEAVGRHLQQLELTGLVRLAQARPDLEYLFRHVLVQQASYDSLLKNSRRRLHQRVAEAIEALYPQQLEQLAPALAHHFRLGGQEEKAVHYLLLAGEQARANYAHGEAATYFQVARKLSTGPARAGARRQACLGLGNVYGMEGKVNQAIEALEEALELTADSSERALILSDIAMLYGSQRHDTATVAAYSEAALNELGADEKSLVAARVFINLGHQYHFLEPMSGRDAGFLQKARQILEGSSHTRDLLECYAEIAFIQSARSPEEAVYYGERALAIEEENVVQRNNTFLHNALGKAYLMIGKVDQAVVHLQQGLQIARQYNSVVEEGYILMGLARAYLQQEAWIQLIEYARQAQALWQRIGHQSAIRDVDVYLIIAYSFCGQEELAAQLEAGLQKEENWLLLSYNLACCWAIVGQHEKALIRLAEDFTKYPEPRRQWMQKDPDLRPLHDYSAFHQLFERK